MTHRIEVNVETGEVTQIEYTTEEQVVYDAAVAQQEAESSMANDVADQQQTSSTSQ